MLRGSRTVSGLVLLSCLVTGCAPLSAPGAVPGSGGSSGGGSEGGVAQPSRQVALGQPVSGTLPLGGAHEYAVQVQAGVPVNAVLEVPHAGSVTQLQASIYQPHPVTGALHFEQSTIVGSDEGEPGATDPVVLRQEGTLIVRVYGVDSRFGGRYTLRVLPTLERAIRLGEAVHGQLVARGDTDDYTLTVDRPVRFNARLAAPYRGSARMLEVQVYRRDPVTSELHFLQGTIADSDESSASATDPVIATGAGSFVVRVHGMEAGGAYELVAEQL
jgi:hypothetical protein